MEERLLTLAFQSDPELLLPTKIERLIATPLTKRIWEEYKKFSVEKKKLSSEITFSPSEFAATLPGELVHGFAELTLADTEGLVDEPESLKREFDLVVHDLEVIEVRHRLEELGVEIRQFEEAKESAKLKRSQEKFGELSQKLSDLEEKNPKFAVFNE